MIGGMPTAGRAAALGLVLGVGLLVKQTFVLYALVQAIFGALPPCELGEGMGA